MEVYRDEKALGGRPRSPQSSRIQPAQCARNEIARSYLPFAVEDDFKPNSARWYYFPKRSLELETMIRLPNSDLFRRNAQ
jgi:hypothetical protein